MTTPLGVAAFVVMLQPSLRLLLLLRPARLQTAVSCSSSSSSSLSSSSSAGHESCRRVIECELAGLRVEGHRCRAPRPRTAAQLQVFAFAAPKYGFFRAKIKFKNSQQARGRPRKTILRLPRAGIYQKTFGKNPPKIKQGFVGRRAHVKWLSMKKPLHTAFHAETSDRHGVNC